jgi:hypothetical protein
MAVDTLGHLLALHFTPANFDDRAKIIVDRGRRLKSSDAARGLDGKL